MKRYLSKLDKIENRGGEDYFVMKGLLIDNVANNEDYQDFLYRKRENQFDDNSFYIIDYDEQNQRTQPIEICSWGDLKTYVFNYGKGRRPNSKALEQYASFMIKITDSNFEKKDSLIEKVIRFDSDEEELKEFKANLLSQAIRQKKSIGWAINQAKDLFASDEESYWPDIEWEIYSLLDKHRSDASLWQEAINHDPNIVQFAEDQKTKYLFLEYSPFENKDNILSRPQYKMYQSELFYQLQAKKYKTWLKSFLKVKSVIFDIEGNPDGWAWEYYIHRLSEKKESEFERRIDEDGKYHHITSTEWKPFDNLIRGANIIIGHNIRRHDLKLLSNRENNTLSIDSKTIWDTLEIEVLLNQARDTYALIVPHKAKEDVQITEKLFWSQLQRILASENAYQRVKDFLPKCLEDYLQRQIPLEEKKYISESLKKELDIESSDTFFYKYQHFSFPRYVAIEDNTLIVTPKHYWKDLSATFENISFIHNDEMYDKFAYLNKAKIATLYSSSPDSIERALYYYTLSNENVRICSIPDYFLNYLGIDALMNLIDSEARVEPFSVFCTDSFNFFNCNNLIPATIKHVVFMDIEEDGLLGSKHYSNLGQHEQDVFITSIKHRGSYSKHKKRFTLSNDCLKSIVKERDIKAFSFWAFQPDGKTISLMYFVNPTYLVESIKDNRRIDISEEEWDSNNRCEDHILYATLSGISFRMPGTIENNRDIYWRQQYEIVIKTNTAFPKVWILDTNIEVEEAYSYINELQIADYHFPAYRILENAVENPSKVCVISWEDILSNKRTIDSNFCFFINDISRFISVSDLSYDACIEVPTIIKTLNGIKDKLLTFGCGSDIIIIDPFFEAHKYLLPQIFGDNGIDTVESDTKYVEGESNSKYAQKEYEEIVSWIEQESKLIFNEKENISYKLSDIQKIAIKRHCIFQGSIKNFLTVIPTGGGKSVIFQGPLLYNAIKKGSGKLSIVVTPLQALMKDQVDDIVKKNNLYNGRVAYIHSGVSAAKQLEVIKAIKRNDITLLYISPERLLFSHFFKNTISYAAVNQGIDTIIFDEAHCITSWGTDFRPSYLFSLKKCLELQERNPEISIQMFTATMSAQSEEELQHYVNLPKENIVPCKDSQDPIEIEKYNLALCPISNHINLTMNHVEKASSDQQLELKVKKMWEIISINSFLEQYLLNGTSRAIIFTKKRKESSEGARILKEILHGKELEKKIDYFHAKLNDKDKERIADAYKSGEILILFATKAFGLGMNVKNIHFVGHLTPPSFIEDYLQEVGRAGRDISLLPSHINPINAICLYTEHDIDTIQKYDDELEWEDVSQAFESIKDYINNYRKEDKRNYYAVPINLLSRESIEEEGEGEGEGEHNIGTTSNETKFLKSLAWLSDPIINRIHIGFYCSDVYELKFVPEKKGLLQGSVTKNIYDYAYRKFKANDNCDYIVLRANEIISNPIFDVNSPEECDSLIETCIHCGIFKRDYMYVGVTINKNKYLQKEVAAFINEEKPLKALFILNNMLQSSNTGPFDLLFDSAYTQLTEQLGKQLTNEERETLYSIIHSTWEYSMALSQLYSLLEIKEKAEKLIRILYKNNGKSIHLLRLMREMEVNNDVDELKAFALLLYKLNYLNKGNLGLDYIEINIINMAPLNDSSQNFSDAKAKNHFDDFYSAKTKKALAMSNLITNYTNSDNCKEEIRKYSLYTRHKEDNAKQE